MEGGSPVPVGLYTVGAQAVTFTPAHPLIGAFGTLNAGSITLGAQAGITTVNDTAIGFFGLAGATLTNSAGTVSYTANSALPGLAALSTSPGLAGTAGIQPQFNADGLADWARRLAAAIAPADEAAAAALG